MALIRALALHIPVDVWDHRAVVDRTIGVIDTVLNALKTLKIEPWTFRIVYPVLPTAISCSFIENLMNDLNSLFPRSKPLVGISMEGDNACLERVAEYLEHHSNLYIAVRCDTDYCTTRVVDNVYRAKTTNINIFTKFAIVFGYWVETPYFPATSNVSNVLGFSASLRYVDLVSKLLVENEPSYLFNFVNTISNSMISLSKYTNIPFLGIDMSLSPWKDESIAQLIEKLIEGKFGYPGTLNVIHSLNLLIRGLSAKLNVKTIGFNEVMLPVAEDSLLNVRVSEGVVRLRDLINYSLVCVAGLDMVALPRDLDIRRIAIDMLTVFKHKNRSIGMRIIPTDLNSGEKVFLDRFGETYVINP